MKARIPLSAFQVPAGKLAITLNPHGIRCVTVVMDARDIDHWLGRFKSGMEIKLTDRADLAIHCQVRELLSQDLRKGKDADLDACTVSSLWLALNHPLGAATVRGGVAASLKAGDRAQLTIASDVRDLWSFIVSDKPAEPQAMMAVVPVGINISLTFSTRDSQPAMN